MLKDATASSNNQQALFFRLSFVLFGGCTWETFGSAGFLLPRFPARVQLPPFAWKRLGQLFLFMQRELAMPYGRPSTSGNACQSLFSGGEQ
ncbi:hypothetical protein C1X21_00405 [Pseudomonas sp. FW305-3-2-15-A-LB2]|nr:hypothetical protein C1X17_00405 [Pseudomonas sp. FW305-3-2-15-C-TSA2]PMV32537.1 hypothetical protein C1X22_00405 [Pseudomonas sp. DP16D-L5]PMV42251.1 hypothetical protein C1X21_00405 [Pseudomonas sp. FW305-3-2-15-A-LB2]PMV49709.1 hypothetical protein C1X16_01995 [Pseudomonas sp. FW305-3-2-15-C-R2A1]PMV55175.1 hypothetical protein C1X18_00405 [Pseudomonas sp. FW305-3-2-15-C-LB1]PMV59702.1 hypothetical protein C1X19_00405 [Pseudomonas sp. GW460-4]PMV66402.1 hypothetical protein C1X20_00405 